MVRTIAKQNGVTKKESAIAKKEVQKKLAAQAIGKDEKPIVPVTEKPVEKIQIPVINLDDRMQKFEQLKGLAGQRERLASTLTELTKFKYNQSDSASFFVKDSNGLEFKTTNTNLIHLVTGHLKFTLETRKAEIEKQLIAFEL